MRLFTHRNMPRRTHRALTRPLQGFPGSLAPGARHTSSSWTPVTLQSLTSLPRGTYHHPTSEGYRAYLFNADSVKVKTLWKSLIFLGAKREETLPTPFLAAFPLENL